MRIISGIENEPKFATRSTYVIGNEPNVDVRLEMDIKKGVGKSLIDVERSLPENPPASKVPTPV